MVNLLGFISKTQEAFLGKVPGSDTPSEKQITLTPLELRTKMPQCCFLPPLRARMQGHRVVSAAFSSEFVGTGVVLFSLSVLFCDYG